MQHDQLVPRGRKSLTLQGFYLQLAGAPVGRRGRFGGTLVGRRTSWAARPVRRRARLLRRSAVESARASPPRPVRASPPRLTGASGAGGRTFREIVDINYS